MSIPCSSVMETSTNQNAAPALSGSGGRNFLQSLPAETRNSIYELLVIYDQPIKITTLPRGRKQKRSRFLALTLVNKAIGHEAKTTFYSLNIFIFGNGRYGSTIQANLHGLRSFIRLVPKDCLALIRHLHLHIFFSGLPDSRDPNSTYEMNYLDIKELETVTKAIFKHLKGVKDVLTEPRKLWRDLGPVQGLQGYAEVLKLMMALPTLKGVEFKDENYRDWHEMKKLVYRENVGSMDT
ncbi:hypothetical protein BDZ45DRAFT_782648 [Acephala macrosclerotiorum]|nr:hypothetical protein BDZ45DRAFT_782648 [Acephala macrosclerotiorum]